VADDRRRLLLRAALAFLQLPPRAPELQLLHRWVDTWAGLGLILTGMTRQGFQLGLDQRTGQWLAVFYSGSGSGGHQPVASAVTARALVLDGEVAVYDRQLRSRFEWLRERDHDAVASPPLYMVFDILYGDRRDLTGRPLRDRRARLEDVVAGSELVFPFRLALLCRSRPIVGDGLLEILVLLAGDEADPLQGGEVLLGLGQVVGHEVRLTEVLVGAAMAGIELQRAPVMREGWLELAALAVGVAEVVLDVGVARVAKDSRGKQPDRGIPVLGRDGRFPGRVLRVELSLLRRLVSRVSEGRARQ
jgi:hypothetical protein